MIKISNFAFLGSLMFLSGCSSPAKNQSPSASSCPDVKFPSSAEINNMSTAMLRIKYRTAEAEKENFIYSGAMGSKVCAGEGLYTNAWRSVLVDRLKDENAGLRR